MIAMFHLLNSLKFSIFKIHDNQMIFNKKLIQLRDKKSQLVDELNKHVERLSKIENFLGQKNEKKFQKFALRLEEQPEK